MATTSPARGKWGNRSTWVLVLGMGFITWFLWPYLSLLVAMTLVISDRKPNQPTDSIPSVHTDNIKQLSKYPPEHMALFLRSPSTHIRAIACQVLASPEMVASKQDWKKVPGELAKVAAYDSDNRISDLAFYALRFGRKLHKEDLLLIRTIAGPDLPAERRENFVDCAGHKCGPDNVVFLDWIEALTMSELPEDRILAVNALTKFFPNHEGINDFFRNAARGAAPESIWRLNETLQRIALRDPQILHDLLGGNECETMMALEFLGRAHVESMSVVPNGIILNAGSWERRERYELPDYSVVLGDQELVELATKKSRVSLESLHERLRRAAIHYLGRDGDGIHALLAGRDDADHRGLCEILGVVERFSWSVIRANSSDFFFTGQEADLLVSLLEHPEPLVRCAAAGVLHTAFADKLTSNPFQPDTGPLDKKHQAIFGLLLANEKNSLQWLALEYYTHVVPFDESQIDQIVDLIQSVAGNSPQTYAAFSQLTERFPKDERTTKLAQRLLDESEQPTPAVVAAAKYLFEVAPKQTFSQIEFMYRTSDPANHGPLLELMVDFSFRLGGFGNSTVALEIWTSYLNWWVTNPRSCNGRCVREVRSLLNPDIAELGLKRALRFHLSTQNKDIFRLGLLPDFERVLTEVAQEVIESGDPMGRVGAIQILADTKMTQRERRAILQRSMEDSDPRVAIAAVEKTMQWNLANSETMGKLKVIVATSPNSALRSVALENLARHCPRDADTIELVDNLVDDPDFQVRLTARHAARQISQSVPIAAK